MKRRLGNTEEQVAALYSKSVDPSEPDKDGITTNACQKGDDIVLAKGAAR